MAIVFTLFVFVAFYFMIIRPQQQRMKAHNAVIASVAAGDEVVSSGGIVGVVKSVGDRDVRFEIAPGVVVTLAKGAIAQKAPSETGPAELGE